MIMSISAGTGYLRFPDFIGESSDISVKKDTEMVFVQYDVDLTNVMDYLLSQKKIPRGASESEILRIKYESFLDTSIQYFEKKGYSSKKIHPCYPALEVKTKNGFRNLLKKRDSYIFDFIEPSEIKIYMPDIDVRTIDNGEIFKQICDREITFINRYGDFLSLIVQELNKEMTL